MKFKRSFLIVSFALVSIFSFILLNTSVASAADISDVLKSAPQGISVSGYMSNGQPEVPNDDVYKTNSATIINRTGDPSDKGNIVSLADNSSTYGAMWSTKRTFNIRENQTISAWLYFGNGDADTDEINSQGIAFVLQNDGNGVKALGAGDQGMGVYGYDRTTTTTGLGLGSITNKPADPAFILNTAVKNSVALEFDTSLNSMFHDGAAPILKKDTTVPVLGGIKEYTLNSYDTDYGKSKIPPANLGFANPFYGFHTNSPYGASYGHIAVTYPYDSDSYFGDPDTDYYPKFAPFGKSYLLVHSNPQPANLTDAEDQYGKTAYWHHVTIKWTPSDDGTYADLTYYLNDKNPDYSDNIATGDYALQTSKTRIKIGDLHSDDGLARWGFTAANSSDKSVDPKLVAFDSIPDTLYSEADSSIVDTDLNNKEITKDSIDKKVGNGDSLKLNYNLNYLSGTVSWTKIAAQIKIPDNVAITPDADNNIATITYANKATESIKTDGKGDKIESFEHTLVNELSSNNNAATITINAKAVNETSSDINVQPAAAVFRGPEEVSSTSSPAFTIMGKTDYQLSLTGSTENNMKQTYQKNFATLPTNLKYTSDNSSTDIPDFGPDTIIYKIKIGNDDSYHSISNTATSGASISKDIDIRDLFDNDETFWNIFTKNSNIPITIMASDMTTGMHSNTITYNINTLPDKTLSMKVSNKLEFKDINYGDSTEILPRKSDFEVSVKSSIDPWKLEVSTGGLSLNGQPVNNNMALIYKKPPVTPTSSQYNSSVDSTISSSPALIAEDPVKDKQSSWENSDWTDNSGILLKQIGISKAGSYSGKLSWTLTDTLQNNSQ